jgi:hypothetical protein
MENQVDLLTKQNKELWKRQQAMHNELKQMQQCIIDWARDKTETDGNRPVLSRKRHASLSALTPLSKEQEREGTSNKAKRSRLMPTSASSHMAISDVYAHVHEYKQEVEQSSSFAGAESNEDPCSKFPEGQSTGGNELLLDFIDFLPNLEDLVSGPKPKATRSSSRTKS